MRRAGGRSLPVIYSDIALTELDEIAHWNELTYNREHAKRYIQFLERRIDGLGKIYARGRVFGPRPELRYLLIQRTTKRHGHVAVYSFNDEAINVLHVFHTAQDWQTKLSDE